MNQKEINKMLIDNKYMIRKIAYKAYAGIKSSVIDWEDFMQEAFYESAILLKRYNPNRGALSTFLYANLSKSLIRFKECNTYSLKTSTHLFECARKVRQYCKCNNIDENSIDENLLKIIIPDNRLVYPSVINMLGDKKYETRLEENFEPDVLKKYKDYNNLDKELDKHYLKKIFNKALRTESIENKNMFCDRYFNNMTYMELGEKYGTSFQNVRMRVKYVMNKLLKKMNISKEDFLYE